MCGILADRSRPTTGIRERFARPCQSSVPGPTADAREGAAGAQRGLELLTQTTIDRRPRGVSRAGSIARLYAISKRVAQLSRTGLGPDGGAAPQDEEHPHRVRLPVGGWRR